MLKNNFILGKIFPFLFFILISTSKSHCAKNIHARNISTQLNPQCENYLDKASCDQYNLIYIKSESHEDVLHFIWSFIGSPSVIIARAPLDTTLSIDWASFIDGPVKDSTINFEGPDPYFSFGWTMLKLWIYSDAKDDVYMDKVNQSQVYGFETRYFNWEMNKNESFVKEDEFLFTLNSNSFNNSKVGPNEAYFSIAIRMKNIDGTVTNEVPKMSSNANTTHVDVSLHNVYLNSPSQKLENPRIGMTYVLVVNDEIENKNTMTVVPKKSQDDEYSPGVFTVYSIISPLMNAFDQSFLQWKPIGYTGEIRDSKESVDINNYNLVNETTDSNPLIQDTLLYAFYSDEINNLVMQSINISFGTQQDGYYNQTNHITWTFLIGFGIPPMDEISIMVILIFSIGLGLPLLIIFVAALYVLCKQMSKYNYRSRDDLLLGN